MSTPATDAARPTTVLITGANKGLGRETARRLAALGWTVWMGSRDLAAGQSAADGIRADVRDQQPDADLRPVALDVTDDDSVAAAVHQIRESGTGLDVLVNNAGVYAAGGVTTLETTADDFAATYAVNVLGPVRMTHAALPLLRAGRDARLVFVSSGLGTIAHCNDPERSEYHVPGMVYQSSKSALDMIANQYAKDLPEVRVASVDPGYTATDLNGNSGHQSVTEGTDAIVAAASAATIPGRHFDRFDLEQVPA